MGRKEHTIHSFYFSQGKGSAVCNLHQFWHFVVKRRFWTIFMEQHAFWVEKLWSKKVNFFFTFSCFPSRWQNVKLSVLSEIASLEIILLSVAIVNMSTQTPFKRIISMFHGILASLCNLISSASSLPHAALYSSALFHYYMINDDHHDPNPRSMP